MPFINAINARVVIETDSVKRFLIQLAVGSLLTLFVRVENIANHKVYLSLNVSISATMAFPGQTPGIHPGLNRHPMNDGILPFAIRAV